MQMTHSNEIPGFNGEASTGNESLRDNILVYIYIAAQCYFNADLLNLTSLELDNMVCAIRYNI